MTWEVHRKKASKVGWSIPVREVRASAPGKVNVILRAGAPDADGYHELVTVFECLNVRESVTVRTS